MMMSKWGLVLALLFIGDIMIIVIPGWGLVLTALVSYVIPGWGLVS